MNLQDTMQDTPRDTTRNDHPGRYAAAMGAYLRTTSSLLARLDGCLGEASAPSGAVKPASPGTMAWKE